MEQEKARMDHELEMARIQAQNGGDSVASGLTVDMSSAKRKFTLPRLEFRQFGDEIKDWLPFWSQFEQIHKDEEIPPEDKFQYLIQATVVGSRAREVVESFPPTGANYSKAIESLQSRFGREDILVEFYVRELLKLIISVQTKEKVSLTFLYDKLESYLRALESLEVTTEVNACILYPMVESCFPAEFLKAWNRSTSSTSKYDAKNRLKNLMEFLKAEVQSEERINLAVAGFGLNKEHQDTKPYKKKNYSHDHSRNKVSTAAGLFTATSTTERNKCIFCEGKHLSSECFTAQKMSLSERQKIVKDKRCCFACLSLGHAIKNCRAVLRCLVCSKKHVPLMCDKIESQNKPPQKKEEKPANENEVNMSNVNERNSKVFLQTIKAIMISNNKKKVVRLLLDSGSQRSYLLKSIAKEMNCVRLRQEKLVHSLFGGVATKEISHNCYKIRLRDLKEEFACNFDVMDQDIICEDIRPVSKGPWISELERDNIFLSDISDTSGAVDILIGADILGKLLTGKRKMLSSGLVAVETYLGWTLMGKVPGEKSSDENLAMTVTSMFVKEADISSLWRLDLIGITDPIEKKSRQEIDLQTKEHFLETVRINKDGRYEVSLPWADDKSPLPENLHLAKKRLDYTTSKLVDINLYQEYENVFSSWLEEGIIEEVPQAEVDNFGHYLPHRPVIRPSSTTTPIRPVFDASARQSNHPSLNQCLECGPNLIELLPDLLLRFREGKIGVIGDIRRAFCQISIRPEDREFLRFLWWKNVKEKELKYFRHTRVVFGVNCSPFLLASVIDYHIRNIEGYDRAFQEKLAHSFYVDNVVTSVDDKEELEKFIHDSTTLMAKGRFQLGEWEHSGPCNDNEDKMETRVLGLIWNKQLDSLKIDMNWIKDIDTEKVTKRNMLSTVHKVFDPFGFVSPVMLYPKLLLQKAWKKGITWDEEIKCELRKEYLLWLHELDLLKDIEIPRYIKITEENLRNCTLHTFVDGSQDAYAAVIFLTIEKEDKIEVSLLAAKSRVSSLRGTTIPRMELLAAVIGTRLANSIIEALHLENIERFYWSDSTTVLAWILRDENWSVFVRNRVKEIRELSEPSSWRHVPGEKNPADLPSRGCRAKHLLTSKWWEGPQWMKDPCEYNQLMNTHDQKCDEEEIRKEKPKSSCSLTNNEVVRKDNWFYEKFSKYENIVRLVAWILRFKHNCLRPAERRSGELSAAEFSEAEVKIILMIQREDFTSEKDARLKTFEAFKDEKGITRLKTKITYRKDKDDFLKPAIFLQVTK